MRNPIVLEGKLIEGRVFSFQYVTAIFSELTNAITASRPGFKVCTTIGHPVLDLFTNPITHIDPTNIEHKGENGNGKLAWSRYLERQNGEIPMEINARKVESRHMSHE